MQGIGPCGVFKEHDKPSQFAFSPISISFISEERLATYGKGRYDLTDSLSVPLRFAIFFPTDGASGRRILCSLKASIFFHIGVSEFGCWFGLMHLFFPPTFLSYF
jgi:hypothetical protein